MTMLPQNELETCLIKASMDKSESDRFYKSLLSSEIFFLPHTYQRMITEEQPVDTSTPVDITIQKIEVNEQMYIPFFSSVERIQQFISQDRIYYKMPSVDFFKMLMTITNPSPLILNPGSDYGKIFSVYELEILAKGMNPVSPEKIVTSPEDKLIIQEASEYPYELIEALIKYFKKQRTIKQAFLAHILNPSAEEKPHTIIIIDTNHLDDIVSEIGGIVNNTKIPHPPVDIAQFSKNSSDTISEYCKKIKPFYKKKTFWIF